VAEIGYELKPVFQGMGFMSETIQCVADYGFGTLGLGKLEAYTHAENIRSIRLLEKNHFILEVDRKDEGNIHQIIYSLTRPSQKVPRMEN
jgi:ribosomal-protein-alanine N-acetyltransferase